VGFNRLVFAVRLAGLIVIFIGQIGWAVKLTLRHDTEWVYGPPSSGMACCVIGRRPDS
jgi:hypothetical protein